MTPQDKWHAAIDAHHEDIENGASNEAIAKRVGCAREFVRRYVTANPTKFPRYAARVKARLARKEARDAPPPKSYIDPKDRLDYCHPAALRAVRMRWGTSQERPK